MLNVRENVDISSYSTLKVGGNFRFFTEIDNKDQLPGIYSLAMDRQVPVVILGGGSNILFSDGIVNVFAVKMKILGFEIINETEEYADVKIGAGENWDEIVEKTINMNFAGFESLSAIPGTVGATPVQNVGAYGAEVKDMILSVEVFDTRENNLTSLSNKDCKFGYRDSIFKQEAKGRYVITAVVYRLKKVEENTALRQKRKEIIKTRSDKLPNPSEIPNVGSFFKNPIVPNSVAEKIQKEYTDAKLFPVDKNLTKVPAGWMIEQAGLKGKSFGKVSVYDKNALVLVNNGGATKKDFLDVKNEIIRIIYDKFGITLEQEPEII